MRGSTDTPTLQKSGVSQVPVIQSSDWRAGKPGDVFFSFSGTGIGISSPTTLPTPVSCHTRCSTSDPSVFWDSEFAAANCAFLFTYATVFCDGVSIVYCPNCNVLRSPSLIRVDLLLTYCSVDGTSPSGCQLILA